MGDAHTRRRRICARAPQKAPLSETHPGDYALYEPPRFARTTLAGDGSSVRASHASGARGGSARPIRSEDPLRLGARALLTALCESDARALPDASQSRRGRHVEAVRGRRGGDGRSGSYSARGDDAERGVAVHRPDGKNRATFVAGGGMGSLLDLAARCAETLRPATLSVLADILEEPKTHLFFHEWRSAGGGQARRLAPAGAPAITLVLNLWRAEEEKIGTPMTRRTPRERGAPHSRAARVRETRRERSRRDVRYVVQVSRVRGGSANGRVPIRRRVLARVCGMLVARLR